MKPALDNAGDEELVAFSRAHREYRGRNAFCLWWVGVINNFHYCLVLSSSLSLAESYGMRQYVALITWANVFFGIVARAVNAVVLPLLSFNVRVTATTFLGLVALLLLSFAYDIGGHNNVTAFVVMLIGVTFVGIESNYGESVFLGYLERLPSKQVGAWSSGTGLSGVAASLIYLGMSNANISTSTVFLASIPLLFVYWALYFFGFKLPVELPDGGHQAMVNWWGTSWKSTTPVRDDEMPPSLKEMRRQTSLPTEDYVSLTAGESCDQRPGTFKRCIWPAVKSMHRLTMWNNFNLATVYVAEYAVQFMAPFCFPCEQLKESYSFWSKNAFVITQFCYQIGVLISRSSLVCVRIRRVWILTLIQVANAFAWFAQAKTHYLSDANDEQRQLMYTFILFGWMVFVGLMGGASYVNVFYYILKKTKEMQDVEISEFVCWHEERRALVPPSEGNLCGDGTGKEAPEMEAEEANVVQDCICHINSEWKVKRDMAMNIGAFYVTVGITLGSILDLFFTVVVLSGGGCS